MAFITPTDFQTIGLGWITAISLVALALIAAVAQVWAKVELLIKGHAANSTEIANNARAIQAAPPAPAVTIVTSGAQTPPQAGGQNDDRS